MTHRYGEKTMDCLRLAALPIGTTERDALWAVMCARWSEKAVRRKIASMPDLFDYGVSARWAWLTDEGKAALRLGDPLQEVTRR